jgi:hypothetical protein
MANSDFKKINRDETTDRIRSVLQVNLTIREVENLIIETEKQLAKQVPYFEARLLHRLDRLKLALSCSGDE